MTNQTQAARLLVKLVRTQPDYDALSAEYGATLPDALPPLPADFPQQTLDLLRTDPEIDRYAENLSRMESYGPEDFLTPEVVLAALVLLSVRFKLKRDKNGKWTFEGSYAPNGDALKPILSVLGAVLGKMGEGLTEASKAMKSDKDND